MNNPLQSNTGQTPFSLTISEAAANKVKQLIQEENDPSLCLRAWVTPGGCQGLEYGFAFDGLSDIDKETDAVFETQGITLIVDQYILERYLNGATIDYQNDISGARFIVQNPNAAGNCGCGISFCEKKDTGTEEAH